MNNLRLGGSTFTSSGTMSVSVASTIVTSGTNGGFAGVGAPGTGTSRSRASLTLGGTANLALGRNTNGNGTIVVSGGFLTLSGPSAAINLGPTNRTSVR